MKEKIIIIFLSLIPLFLIISYSNSEYELSGSINYAYYSGIQSEGILKELIPLTVYSPLERSSFRKGTLKPFLIIDEKIKDKIDINNIIINNKKISNFKDYYLCKNNNTYCLVLLEDGVLQEQNIINLNQDLFNIKGGNTFIGITYSNE